MPDRPQFALEIMSGPQTGRIFALHEGDFVIGRGARCSISLPDESVAPTHCAVRVRADQVLLAPGGTINTTTVNGHRLTAARLLRINDRVQVGAYELALRLHASGQEVRFAVGTQVGPFTVVAELGSGAVGRVYEAKDGQGRSVALKVLRKMAGWTPQQEAHRRALFRREAAVLAAINHPNVVRTHGSGEHQGLPWLAMELLSGATLREKLVGGRFEVREVERIMFQLCAAVGAVHWSGIIHRDLKPANVMLDGPNERVVLADFGLAQIQGAPRLEDLDPPRDAGVIRVGRQIGTPAYMAPEQTTGADCDQRSDVWALGAVLYELAAGVRPFPGNDVRTVLTDVVHGCPAPLPDDVAPYMRGVVYRCLQKRPDLRFTSAGEMVDALHEKRVVQWLPCGPDGPKPLVVEACPWCGKPIRHPLRCLDCGGSIFRYTDGQVLMVPQPDAPPALACGKCAGTVGLRVSSCPTCHTAYQDLPPQGLSKSVVDLTVGRALVVDVYDQALAHIERCPYCNGVRRDSRPRCNLCGLNLKGYATQRIKLELAVGGWTVRCGWCGADTGGPAETHCPQCGLNFANGQRPDGSRFDDELQPTLKKRMEDRRGGHV